MPRGPWPLGSPAQLPRARAVFGTLSDLAAGKIGELQDDAGTIIIGEVVQFARELNSLIQQPYLRAYA